MTPPNKNKLTPQKIFYLFKSQNEKRWALPSGLNILPAGTYSGSSDSDSELLLRLAATFLFLLAAGGPPPAAAATLFSFSLPLDKGSDTTAELEVLVSPLT